MAVKTVANTLSESGDVFSRDEDPELVRDAIPFALKLYESLLESVPRHVPLLVATCSGFTQYAYAFVETDAVVLGDERHEEARALRERALKLYLRGRGYCLRAMEVRWQGISEKLLADPGPALARAEREDVELLYWTAASWGAAISLGLDRPELAIDFPVVRALADRALALDETWSNGALHELMISLDSLPEALGGDADASPAALRPRGRTAEGPVARAVRRAGDGRVGARAQSRGVRETAPTGAGRRSQRAAFDAPRRRSSRSGVRARCSIRSTAASCNRIS